MGVDKSDREVIENGPILPHFDIADTPVDPELARHTENKVEAEAATSKELGVTAGAITLFLFIRLLAVSGWHWGTAADIADSFNFDDAVSIALGTLFELPIVTGIIASLILPLAIFRVYWNRGKKTAASQFKNLLIIATLGVTLFVLMNSFRMWWPIATSALLVLLLIIASHIWSTGRAHKFLASLGKHTGLLFLGSIFALALLVDTPWMPREAITTEDGVIHGHVLEATPGFLKVLTDEREVVILVDSDIIDRTTIDN